MRVRSYKGGRFGDYSNPGLSQAIVQAFAAAGYSVVPTPRNPMASDSCGGFNGWSYTSSSFVINILQFPSAADVMVCTANNTNAATGEQVGQYLIQGSNLGAGKASAILQAALTTLGMPADSSGGAPADSSALIATNASSAQQAALQTLSAPTSTAMVVPSSTTPVASSGAVGGSVIPGIAPATTILGMDPTVFAIGGGVLLLGAAALLLWPRKKAVVP